MSQFQHHYQLQHHHQQQHQQLHDFFQKPKESGNTAKTGFNKNICNTKIDYPLIDAKLRE